MLCAVIKAVDEYAHVLRAAIASAGNDHRLGSHEAPPAIISIYLGDQLNDIIGQIEKGSGAKSSKAGGTLEVGVDTLPTLPRHASDRNRTSPFAFTGSKFEFRSVGSNASLAGANVVINTIVAQALDEICTELEKAPKKSQNKTVQKILKNIITKHKRVIYNGDNYTEAWIKEAKKRGLPNLKTTPEALKCLKDKDVIDLFERHKVLNKKELDSRFGAYQEAYETIIKYEADLMVEMARTLIIPTAVEYQGILAEAIRTAETINKTKSTASRKLLKEITQYTEAAIAGADGLEKAASGGNTVTTRAAMAKLRSAGDALEGLVPAESWPLPSYSEMLFIS